jgi:hypothetical protein
MARISKAPAPDGPPGVVSALARSLSSVLKSMTLYAASCISGGSVAALFHEPLKLEVVTAFALGFFVMVGPVYLTYASGRGMRRMLVEIRNWEQSGLIDPDLAQELRDRAVEWFIARRF